MLARPLPLRQERLERGAMDQQRPADVDRLQSFPQPLSDRIAVNAEELRDLRDIVADAGLNPVQRIAAAFQRPLFGLRIGVQALRCAAMRSEIQRSTSSSIQATHRVEIETGAGKRPSPMYE